MDNLEFLDGAPAPNAETQPETPVAEAPVEQPQAEQPTADAQPETAEQKATRERDERGRFKAKETADDTMVPLKALHETRDKVRDLEARLAALQGPQQQPQANQAPDMFGDPEGYTAYIQNQITSVTLNDRLNVSEEMVRQSAGDEAVNAAQEWGKQMLSSNPAFAQAFYAQRNPYGFLVQQHQKYTVVSQLGDDPKEIQAFLQWKATQGGQPQPAQANQQQPTPPRSIASATSAGGVSHQAMGPGVAFDNVIK